MSAGWAPARWSCQLCPATGTGGATGWEQHYRTAHRCPRCAGTGRAARPLRDAQPPTWCPDCDGRGLR